MLDLVIRGGQIVTPMGVGEWDIAVQGEKIVAVAAPGALPDDAGRVIDATGMVVCPGFIDTPMIEPNSVRSSPNNTEIRNP